MTKAVELERFWRRELQAERHTHRVAATASFSACEENCVEDFYAACDLLLACSVDGWRLAMMKIGKLPSINSEIQAAFVRVWIESKMLPLKVGDRRVLADALHILMRAGYTGAPLTLYRGTSTMRLDVEFTGSAGRQISSSQEALLSIGRTRTSRTQASCCRH